MTVPVAGGTVKAADVTRLIAAAGATLTISSGSVTATPNSGHGFHKIAAETGTTDDLDTVSGLAAGELLVLLADSGDTITIKHGTGNFDLPDDSDLTLEDDNPLQFLYDGSNLSYVGRPEPPERNPVTLDVITTDVQVVNDSSETFFATIPLAQFIQVDDVGLRAYSSKGFIEGDKELIQSAIDKHKPSAELKARTSGIVDSLNGKKINNLNDDALRLALFVVYDFLGWIDDNDKILIP